MINVTQLDPTGFTATFTYTSGVWTVNGNVTVEADKSIRVMSGDVSKTIDTVLTKVGTFSFYYSSSNDTIQDDTMGIVKACRAALREYLDELNGGEE